MTVLVLGAGVIGVAAAWYLARRATTCRWSTGARARLSSRATPTRARCRASRRPVVQSGDTPPPAALAPAARRSALVWRPRLRADQWRWLALFLRECAPARYSRNLLHLATIGLYSRETLRASCAPRRASATTSTRAASSSTATRRPIEQAAAAARRLRRTASSAACATATSAWRSSRRWCTCASGSRAASTRRYRDRRRAPVRAGGRRARRRPWHSFRLRGHGSPPDRGGGQGRRARRSTRRRSPRGPAREPHRGVRGGPHAAALLAPAVGVRETSIRSRVTRSRCRSRNRAAALRIGITDAAVKVAFSRLGTHRDQHGGDRRLRRVGRPQTLRGARRARRAGCFRRRATRGRRRSGRACGPRRRAIFPTSGARIAGLLVNAATAPWAGRRPADSAGRWRKSSPGVGPKWISLSKAWPDAASGRAAHHFADGVQEFLRRVGIDGAVGAKQVKPATHFRE